ncbi:hypothetical protein A1359_01280 [Methylomonas lenta]|uniref:Uncharacterized protein n=1 Tax=Methylomonas lenta TaxID=980561 RepID=A0A177N7Q2_9GAMM|nr:hypothetical protein [Methylomonas lenta]OAI14066.1 hypothetical protein A1359_01280 [Methylomonas lenta]
MERVIYDHLPAVGILATAGFMRGVFWAERLEKAEIASALRLSNSSILAIHDILHGLLSDKLILF